MATKLIKKKVVFLTVGTKKYKYIETLLEVKSKKKKPKPAVVDCIDLTEDSPGPSTIQSQQQCSSSPGYNQETHRPYFNSPRYEQF